MSDLAKWGLLLGTLVAVLALIVQLPAFGVLDDIFKDDGAAEIAMAAIDTLSVYLLAARRVINNFVYPEALTVMICFSLFMWLIFGVIRVGTMISKYILK